LFLAHKSLSGSGESYRFVKPRFHSSMAFAQDCRYLHPPVAANCQPASQRAHWRVPKLSACVRLHFRQRCRVAQHDAFLYSRMWTSLQRPVSLPDSTCSFGERRKHAGVQKSFRAHVVRHLACLSSHLPPLFDPTLEAAVPYTFLQTSLRFMNAPSTTDSGNLPR
jgi:hypothetical protein